MGTVQPLTIEELAELNPKEIAKLRYILQNDFRAFCNFVFILLEGAPMIWSPVQLAEASFLSCIDGTSKSWSGPKITRAIFNSVPRFGKSFMLALWCAWWLIRENRCRFMYLSGSDDVAKEQSSTVTTVLSLQEVQFFWPIRFSQDTKSKGLWRIDGGGWFRAVTTGGQVMGFGAGLMVDRPGFFGCLIVDDPLKPEDTTSEVKMETFNGRYNRTIKSRLNNPRVPILLAMQRLNDSDLSGFLLGGGSGEKWYHLRIPGLIDQAEEQAAYDRYKEDWDHGIPIEFLHKEGYVWEYKHGPKEDSEQRLIPDVWSAQIMQNPRMLAGSVFKTSWFKRWQLCDIDGSWRVGRVWVDGKEIELVSFHIFGDTASTENKKSDYSVFQLWAIGADKNIYLLDQLRGKWEIPQLEIVSREFLKQYAYDPPRRKYGWRDVYIEDKNSGTGLIQQLKGVWGAQRIVGVPRGIDKVVRAYAGVLPLQRGQVRIPMSAPWVPAYIGEFAAFSKMLTHAHDDQIDPTLDAIETLIGVNPQSILDMVG